MNKQRKLIRLIIKNRKFLIITMSLAVIFIIISCALPLVLTHTGKNVDAVASPGAIAVTGNDFTYVSPTLENNDPTITAAPEPVIDEEVTSFVPSTEMDLDPSSITVYVNKEYALSKNYKPSDLVTPNIHFDILTYDERTLMRSEAAKAIEKLFAAAEKDGCFLSGVSGYRSYARQYKIFTNNIVTQGKTHTLQYSAVPGTSEHQTGLSMDVSTKSLNYKLSDEFADTLEGKWLANNSYKYGFIIRYPKDKADITGYAYEPWHIRYVGRGLSYYLYDNQLTLDEYYHYTPDPNFDFELMYADIINYVAPTVTVTITPTPTVTVSAATPTPTDTNTDNDNPSDPSDPDENTDYPGDGEGATPVPTPTTGALVTDIPTDDNSGNNPIDNGTDNSDNITGTMDIIIE